MKKRAFIKYLKATRYMLVVKICIIAAIFIAFNLLDWQSLQYMTSWKRLLLAMIPILLAFVFMYLDAKQTEKTRSNRRFTRRTYR